MSNTGVERTRTEEIENKNGNSRYGVSGGAVGVGGFTGTLIPHLGRTEVLQLLEEYLGASEVRGRGVDWYGQSATVGMNGALVAWEPRGHVSPDRSGEVFLSVTQTDCDWLGYDRTQELARKLDRLGFKPTRTDLYRDDRDRLVEPAVVLAAFKSGQCKSRLRFYDRHESGQRGVEREGITVYLGSSTSLEKLRVYDKEAESKVAGAGIRWEWQARKERAVVLFRELLVDGADPGQYFAAQLVRLVDFVDRAPGQAHGERSPRLEWWSQLVGAVQGAKRLVPVVLDCLARRKRWMLSAWPKTIALVVQADGGSLEAVHHLIRVGMSKLGPREWELVERAWLEDRREWERVNAGGSPRAGNALMRGMALAQA